MSNEKKESINSIISAAIGGAFFAIPYVALDFSIFLSLGIGVAAFGAGNLLLNDKEKLNKEIDVKKNLYTVIKQAKEQNAEIYDYIYKVNDKQLQENIKDLYDTTAKIIDTVSKNPKKLDKLRSFFDYYLPVTLKILTKYDLIENQEIDNEETKKFMESAENMIQKINKSFKVQLSNLYQTEIIDTDAEMKVFEAMLKSDGYSDKTDFGLKK